MFLEPLHNQPAGLSPRVGWLVGWSEIGIIYILKNMISFFHNSILPFWQTSQARTRQSSAQLVCNPTATYGWRDLNSYPPSEMQESRPTKLTPVG